MTSITFSDLSGEGHVPLDPSSNLAVRCFEVYVTAIPPKSRLVGLGTIPRGIWQIGECGLGYFSDDPSANVPDVLGEAHFIHREQEIWYIEAKQLGPSYWGSFWWRLTAGATIDCVVTL